MACCNVIMRNSLHEKPLVWSPRLVKIHSEWYSKNLWRLMNVNMIIEKPEFETQIQASWYLIEIFFFMKTGLTCFLAVTKQLFDWFSPSVRPSVRLSVCLSVCHTFFTMFPSLYHHEIFRIYYHGQKWCPCKRSRSEVKGQGHRSTPKLAVSGL